MKHPSIVDELKILSFRGKKEVKKKRQTNNNSIHPALLYSSKQMHARVGAATQTDTIPRKKTNRQSLWEHHKTKTHEKIQQQDK